MENEKTKVEIEKDGPYIVSGNVPLAKGSITAGLTNIPYKWTKGESFATEETYFLCRCGNSSNKPFCDDTHLKIPFDGTETAGHKKYDDIADTFEGAELILKDANRFCSSSAFCMRAGGIGKLVAESDNAEQKQTAVEEVFNCPSGRLVLIDKRTGETIEDNATPSITVAEDPGKGVSGPLFLKGRIEVVDADGKSYEVRNRVTLCRCGKSRNKPFCDGAHIKAGFNDGDKSLH